MRSVQFELVFFLLPNILETYFKKIVLVSQSKLPQILEATNIIIRYILSRFEANSSPNSTPSLTLLSALKSICDGKANNYDNVVLHSTLKFLKYPEHKAGNGGSAERDSPKSEIKRSRSDLSVVIMQQLTQPLSQGTFSFATLSEEETDCTVKIFY